MWDLILEGKVALTLLSLHTEASNPFRSIRIPSAYNGLYGLRPSYGRVPYAGCVNSMEGQDSVPSVLGPISNSMEGIKIFMKAVASQEPWLRDPLAVRKRWNEDEYNLIDHGKGEQLCFAILWHDEFVVPHPPILRGLEMTKEALIAAGHKGAHALLPIYDDPLIFDNSG